MAREAGIEIERVGDVRCALGEGPLWDPVDRVLYWVDSLGPAVWRHDPATGECLSWDLPGRAIGSLALRTRGGAVLALDGGFHFFDFAAGTVARIADPEATQPRTRFNDGKVDRQGRFIAGTMDDRHEDPLGALYRLDPDLSWSRLDRGFVVSNGPCFSPDGRTLYHSDSWPATIFAHDYDPATGGVSNKRVFATTRGLRGAPDGITTDSDGHVWAALVIAGRLARFTPDGRLDRLIDMPVRYVTSVMFGGPDLDVLYVTSIGGSLGGRPANEPEAGALFAVHGLGVTGLPEPRFAG